MFFSKNRNDNLWGDIEKSMKTVTIICIILMKLLGKKSSTFTLIQPSILSTLLGASAKQIWGSVVKNIFCRQNLKVSRRIFVLCRGRVVHILHLCNRCRQKYKACAKQTEDKIEGWMWYAMVRKPVHYIFVREKKDTRENFWDFQLFAREKI